MPKFDVILSRTRVENLTLEMHAGSWEAAQDKAEEALQKLQWDADNIAETYKVEWQVDEDSIEIDSVEEQG